MSIPKFLSKNPQSGETNIHAAIDDIEDASNPTISLINNIMLDLHIESFSLNGTDVKLFPGRGGLTKSIKKDETEILYQDMYKETLLDTEKSVKGGIPFMIPNSGPLTNKQKEKSGIDLPQHGIGRISPWELSSDKQQEGKRTQVFHFNNPQGYAHKGKVINEVEILEKGGVRLTHHISNHGDTPMPIASGLHPYFRVPEGNKSEIEWEFEGGQKVAEQVDVWSDDGTITFDNPNPGQPFYVKIPGLGRLELTASKDYKKFWVWSLSGKDFVCIEPVMGDEGMIANNPVWIKPGETNSNYFEIDLLKE